MTQRLKRWETPRKTGRNDKGRGGSARQRQKAKQLKALRKHLKTSGDLHLLNRASQKNDNDSREKQKVSPVLL